MKVFLKKTIIGNEKFIIRIQNKFLLNSEELSTSQLKYNLLRKKKKNFGIQREFIFYQILQFGDKSVTVKLLQ